MPFNRNAVLKRYPSSETCEDEQAVSWKTTIIEHLDKLRNQDVKKPRRRKIKIVHGRSLTAEEVATVSGNNLAGDAETLQIEEIIKPKEKDFFLVKFKGKRGKKAIKK